MTAEPRSSDPYNEDGYSDTELQTRLDELYALVDADGRQPGDEDWTPTYDLNLAAADIWQEKAGRVAYEFDYSSLGSSHGRTGKYNHAMRQARHFRSYSRLKTIPIKRE
jgi:hypothetical protein